MKALLAALAFVGTVSAGAAELYAEAPCELRLSPVQVSFGDTALDRPRSGCVSDSLSIGTRAYALIDTPNFYGGIAGALHVDWTTVHASGFEFGIGARVLDATFVQTAVFTDTELSLGPVSLRAARPDKTRWFGKRVWLTHSFAFELPYTHGGSGTVNVAANPSINATMLIGDTLQMHGRLSGQLWAALPDSGADGRGALATSYDVGWGPWESVSFLLGTEAQGGWYGLGLDHIVARGGLRIAVADAHRLEISGGTVVAGEDRSTASLWLGYRWVPVSDDEAQSSANRLRDWAK